MALMADTAYDVYRKRMVPVLYDWFMHYHLKYPTQTCRWGPKVDEAPHKTKYRAYLSEQVPSEDTRNTLLLAHIDVFKPHVSSSEAVSNWKEKSESPHVQIIKTIYHPGEVNKVRELPHHPEIVVTHTDSPQLFVWNMDRQPDRRPQAPSLGTVDKAAGKRLKSTPSSDAAKSSSSAPAASTPAASDEPSVADLVLVGHEKDAQFPLACSSSRDPRVASGGNDKLVLVWDLADQMTSLTAKDGGGGAGRVKTPAAAGAGGGGATELKARVRLEGHTATVGDVVFQPGSSQVLMSVADDGHILTWDIRSGSSPASQVADAHGPGVNVMCVDWSAVDDQLVVTGAQDGTLMVWDRRKMSSREDRLFLFEAHRNAPQRDVLHVEWHPTNKDIFASGSEDHTVAIWDLSRTESQMATAAAEEQQAGAAAAAAAAAEGKAGEAGGDAAASAAEARVTRKRARSSADEGGKGGSGSAAAGGAGGGGGGGKGGAKGGGGSAAAAAAVALPPQLIFQHFGHRLGRITDFQWLPSEPWTLISASDNSGDQDGSLQVWRPIDLVYRPEVEVIAELEEHRQFILRGAASPPAKDKAAAKAEPAAAWR